MLCYFKNLDSNRPTKKFVGCDCELWLLAHDKINELSVAWTQAVRASGNSSVLSAASSVRFAA